MVQHHGVTALTVDAQADAASRLELACIAAQNSADVKDRTIMFACINDFEQTAGCGLDHASVADLAAAFRIEWGLRRNDCDAIVISMSGDDLRFSLVAAMQKARGPRSNYDFRERLVSACGARPFALLLHQAVEFVNFNLDAVIAQNVLSQIKWEPIGVV